MKLLGIELKGSYKVEFEDSWLEVYDKNGNEIYTQYSNGDWSKKEYDEKGNRTYFENNKRYWFKEEFDEKGNRTYFENSYGFSFKVEYDEKGNRVYYEDNKGSIIDERAKELTIEEIENLLGYKIKIKGE